MERRVSTGMPGLDRVIDMLRLGDNVVWQVDTLSDYRKVVEPYIRQAKADGRALYYIRFGTHEPVVRDLEGITVYEVDADQGFEYFATRIHRIIEKCGRKAFYVFDCLTDLLKYWYSDRMIGNFFRVTCPYLFELDTIAYFALIRDSHTAETIGRIRDTTQLLLDLYYENGSFYVHPLKVWQRHSATMFFPHKLIGDEAVCISASVDAAVLAGRFTLNAGRMDYWDITFDEANRAMAGSDREKEKYKELLLRLLLGSESHMRDLCWKYFSLRDLLNIRRREIGTGKIGGKSIGMLLARKILERDPEKRFQPLLEMHDSFYIGADVYYTYIVRNDCWTLRTKQKTEEGYFRYAPMLREKLLEGDFSEETREQFRQVLEYFGQSPIIVRSSSLLEDNFGNAFAGKYDSVFCANQGGPEERLEAFIRAVKQVYASTMNEDALQYRKDRGLMEKDEQMALLVQRVSGDHYGEFFFPHMAGVGNSSNLYVWDAETDVNAGMLRLVFGLGTRAVDRVDGDYPRIVNLDDPTRAPLISNGDERKFSQHYMDLINTRRNEWSHYSVDRAMELELHTDKGLFATKDFATSRRKRELGIPGDAYIVDFRKLLGETDFPRVMRAMLKRLAKAYQYPVDIEFCVNFDENGRYRINLLQCRPLQTRGLGKLVEFPREKDQKLCLLSTKGNFMGGNVHYPVDYIVYVKPEAYLALPEQERYGVARKIGELNRALKGKHAILIGHGRWGTTTTSLGVPVNFTELMHMEAIFEVSYTQGHLMPELSYGSHFFQDLVESGVFYGAVFDGDQDVIFNRDYLYGQPNCLKEFAGEAFEEVISVIHSPGMELFSDTVSQRMLCAVV